MIRADAIAGRSKLTSFWTLFWILVCLHQLYFGSIMVASSFVPYVLDGNETFSVWWHAHNLYTFSFWESFGLTDESYGTTEAAHPFIHTHQGNMPRLFGFLIYALGARTVESQVLVTTLIIGNLTLYFCYALIAKLTRPAIAFVFCIFLFSDYLLFAQWHLVTYRIWYGFLFFGVLFAIANAEQKDNGIWPYLLLGLLFFLLLYFELVFAVYVSVICAIFAVWRHWKSPKKIAVIYAVQLVGGVAAILFLFFQLTAALGYDVVIKDFSSTFTARNASTTTTGDPELVKFFRDHNIVFWQNFRDGASLRTITAFARSMGTAVFQIWTPTFFLLVMVPFIGVATSFAEVRHDRARSDRLSYMTGGLISPAVLLPPRSRFEVLRAITSYAGLLAMALGLAVLVVEMIQPGHVFGVVLTEFDTQTLLIMLAGISLLILVLSLANVLNFYGFRAIGRFALNALLVLAILGPAFIMFKFFFLQNVLQYLSTASEAWITLIVAVIALILSMAGLVTAYRVAPSSLAALRGLFATGLIALLFAVNPFLFNQFYSDVWSPLFDDPVVRIGIRITVALVTSAGIAIAVYGARRSFGPFWKFAIGRALLLFLVTFAGYAIIYLLSPGYVLSGYVERLAPFAIFFLAGIPAIAVSSVTVAGYRIWINFRKRQNLFAWSFGSVIVPICLVFAISTIGSLWLRVQTYYFTELPPNYLAFPKKLAVAQFEGASFGVNNYAAVVAYYSRGWATMDTALATPSISTGNGEPRRLTDRSYRWFADWNVNPDYQSMRYYACMKMPTFDSMLALRDPKKFGYRYNFCDSEPILKSGSPFDDRLVASDFTPPRYWSVVALGALRPQIVSVRNSVTRRDNRWIVVPRLQLAPETVSSGLSNEYDLLVAPGGSSCDVRNEEFKSLLSSTDDGLLELPEGFQGAFRVRARAAASGFAFGDWKDSDTWIVSPVSAGVVASSNRCPAIAEDAFFNVSSSIKASGWSVAEDWGTWSIGPIATIRPITVPRALANSDLLLRVDARAFLTKATPSQRITVRANDTVVDNWTLTDSEPHKLTAIIRKALFKDKSLLTLSFEIEKPTSPQSAGISSDSRELGLGVARLTLEELQ